MIEKVEWGKFRLGDLFKIDDWIYGKNKKYVTYSKIPNKDSIAIISGITESNGVSYYTNDKLSNEEIFEAELTISTRGEYSGTVFYHEEKFALANNILVMKMDNLTKKQKLFFASAINALGYGGYSNYPRKETLKEDIIYLPIKENTIDFDFMEKFIDRLEADNIEKLQAYLVVTGLEDYNLTKEEKQSLTEFKQVVWGDFNLEKLFGKAIRGKRLKSSNRVPGELPFITAGEKNEGFSSYIGNNIDIFPANTVTIDMFGSAKFRNYIYGADDHITVINTNNLEKYAAIFVATSIHKSSYNGQFSYSRNFYPKDADLLEIKLPMRNKIPDYKYMELLISAIQKLLIKNIFINSNIFKNRN